MVLDQAAAQDDHPCDSVVDFFLQKMIMVRPVFTLLIANLLISLKSPRMSTTKPDKYIVKFFAYLHKYELTGTWIFEGVKEEHISKTAISQSRRNDRNIIPVLFIK